MIILSQRDPLWADAKLGSRGLLTIGAEGCTTTCLAMLNNKFGANCTPDQVAAHLDWYTPEGLILWDKLNLQKAKTDVVCRERSPVLERIRDYIRLPREKGVLIEVSVPKGKHWLLGDHLDIFGNIFAIDPWRGDICDIGKRYGQITGSAHFSIRNPIVLPPERPLIHN